MPRPTPAERFFAKVDRSGACWLWTGAKTTGGYGCFKEKSYTLSLAHRWSYEHHVGPIPVGLTLDHLCVTPSCVNPDHLEPVTAEENTRRARDRRETCAEGHEFNEANTWQQVDANGWRVRKCRPCEAIRKREWRAKRALARTN